MKPKTPNPGSDEAVKKYWYFISTQECPLCGSSDTFRERRMGIKPEDYQARYSYEQIYDYCDAR